MRKWFVAVAVIAAIFTTVAYVSAENPTPQKPEKGVLVGVAVELSTLAMQGLEYEGFGEASKTRAEQGFPVGILEEDTGEIWVAVYRDPAPASHMETANHHLAPYMGKKVAVTGLKYKIGNLNVIRCSLISEY